VVDYSASGRSSGNKITSRIVVLFVSNIPRRSRPSPNPPCARVRRTRGKNGHIGQDKTRAGNNKHQAKIHRHLSIAQRGFLLVLPESNCRFG
jgi:hypothetical protein